MRPAAEARCSPRREVTRATKSANLHPTTHGARRDAYHCAGIGVGHTGRERIDENIVGCDRVLWVLCVVIHDLSYRKRDLLSFPSCANQRPPTGRTDLAGLASGTGRSHSRRPRVPGSARRFRATSRYRRTRGRPRRSPPGSRGLIRTRTRSAPSPRTRRAMPAKISMRRGVADPVPGLGTERDPAFGSRGRATTLPRSACCVPSTMRAAVTPGG